MKILPFRGTGLGILLCFFATAFNANAANLKRDKELIREAVRAAQNDRIRIAYYKIRIVKVDVESLHPSSGKSKLLNVLNLALEKLNDSSLSNHEKAEIVLDCARLSLEAIQEIEQDQNEPGRLSIRQTISVMSKVVEDVKDNQISFALRRLARIKRALNAQNDHPKIKKAKETIDLFIEKLKDTQLSLRDKISIAKDCHELYLANITDFLNEQDGGENERSSILGITSNFSKSRYQTKVIQLSTQKRFHSIKLLALNDSVFLKRVVFHFSLGRSQSVFEVDLSKGESRSFQLRSNRDGVKKITLIGISPKFRGQTGKIKAVGLK